MRRPGEALARLFGSLANTLLDVGLPRIKDWLSERVPGADVDAIAVDGTLIHADGVRIPIGPRGLLRLERATVQLLSGRGVGFAEMRIHSFHGVLAFGMGEGRTFEADVTFAASPDPDETAWVAGELAIPRASWTKDRAAEPTPMHGAARLVVTPRSWRLDDGLLASAGGSATVRFSGGGSLAGESPKDAFHEAKLVLAGAKVGPFFDAIEAIAGQSFGVPQVVPLDAGLDGELAWDAEQGGRCNLHLSTDGLALELAGEVGADVTGAAPLAAKLSGTLNPAAAMRRANVPASFHPRDEDAIAIAAEITGTTQAPAYHGALRGGALGFRFGRPRFVPAVALSAVDLAFEGTRSSVTAQAAARIGTGTLGVDATIPFATREGRTVSARGADLDASWLAPLAQALGANVVLEDDAAPASRAAPISGRPIEGEALVLPRDLRAHATLAFDLAATELALRGSISATTPRSRLAAEPLVVRGPRLDGTRVVGELAVADAVTVAGRHLGDVSLSAEGPLRLDVALEGAGRDVSARGRLAFDALALLAGGTTTTIRDLDATIDARARRVRIVEARGTVVTQDVRVAATGLAADVVLLGAASGSASCERVVVSFDRIEAPPVELVHVRTLLFADRGRFAWHRAVGHAYAGTVFAAGVVTGEHLHLKIGLRDVAVEQLAIDRAGTSLGTLVQGRLALDLRLERRGTSPLSGKGRASLERGVFPVLERAAPELKRFGLAPPDMQQSGPAHVAIGLGEHGLRLHELAVAVPGCTATGEVWVRSAGDLAGALVVTLAEEYLRKSVVLVLPRVLTERLVLPVRIGGTAREAKIDADLAACFGSFLSDNKVSAFFDGVVQGVFGETQPAPAPAAPQHPPPPADPTHDVDEHLARVTDWDAIARRYRVSTR
jgi:hypothetical protein